MRMRRKRYLDERLEACSAYIVSTEGEKLNALEAIRDTAYIDYEKLFGNGNKVVLEIGCGKGGFICECARRHPEINYIGVERTRNVIVTACEKAMQGNLPNVKFIPTCAAYLPRYIPPESISRIYLNFSNPLPQKSSEKQRLTHPRHLGMYKGFLANGGSIYQKTDDKDFFEYSLKQFSDCGFIVKNVTYDLHNSGETDNIITEHEYKFSKMGLPIYKLEAYLEE